MRRILGQIHRAKYRASLLAVLIPVAMGGVMSPPALVLAAEGKRVAFVVGIGTYDNLPDKQLKNSVNDAEGVAAKLSEIGFKVTKASNPTREAFYAKWYEVGRSLTEEDMFVFFYSGHGVQIRQQNYLLPQDISIDSAREEIVTDNAISLSRLLNDLSQGIGDSPRPKRALVIIDACRNNPFIRSGFTKGLESSSGLANPSTPQGLFVIYSAAENSVSLDRLSADDKARYSVFTRVLLPLLDQPIKLQDLSVKLKKTVQSLTKKVQLPTAYDATDGEEFCLPGCVANIATGGHEREPMQSVQRQPKPNWRELLDSYKRLQAMNEKAPSPQPAPVQSVPLQADRSQLQGMIRPPQGLKLAEPTVVPRQQEKPVQPVGIPTPLFSAVPNPAMVQIAPGSFRVGIGGEDATVVQFSKLFAIARYETTFDEYDRFAQATGRNMPDDSGWGRGQRPVINVSWKDAKAYAEWLSQQTGRRYRLPSEAEWEYAARSGGLDQKWAGTSDETHLKNYAVFQSRRTEPVGTKQPNGLGLYDMSGNVWEWVKDCTDEDNNRMPTDGSARQEANGGNCGERVLRGGAWNSPPENLRVSGSFLDNAGLRNIFVGFRLAQDLP